jgi:hypothetical protein
MAGKTSGEIVITIKNETKKENNTDVPVMVYDTKSVNEFSNSLKNIVHNQAFQYVKDVVVSEARYEVNKNFTLHDDYIGQRDLNIALGITSKIYGIANATISGAIVGGPIGAGIALIGSVAVEAVGVYQRLDQQNIKIEQMNKQLEYNRVRAGYSLTSGSVGENK